MTGGAEPPLAWLDRMAERELATDQRVDLLEAEMAAPLVVLSEPEFEAAVRQALRDYTRPAALAANPLLRSRLASQAAAGAPTSATLQGLLRSAAEALAANPRDERLYRALARTFFEPAATQELAAERLACRSAPTATSWPAASGGSPSGCGSASSTATSEQVRRSRRRGGSLSMRVVAIEPRRGGNRQ
jgi:hypothetical protein